jgi:hypothetical protein
MRAVNRLAEGRRIMANARYLAGAFAVAALLAGCAKPLPSGESVETEEITARVTAIDTQKGTVTLRGPSGRDLTVKARDPANLKKVGVGDLVDISYTEALAVAVRPTAPSKK